MQGLGFLVVCALAALCVAQSNDTQSQINVMPFPAIIAQQQWSDSYANLILDFQSTMGWVQVAQGWQSMVQIDAAQSKAASLEEDDEEMTPLMFGGAPIPDSSKYDEIERHTEHTLLQVVKIQYLQAGQKLARTQSNHYQSKLNIGLIQGALGQAAGPVVSIMYYMEVLRVMSSAYTIQRQDAWNTWLLYEIIETDVFNNGNLPAEFAQLMAQAQVNAMTAYYHEASTDLQLMFLDFYLQNIIAQFTGRPANAAANSAFLEEELTEGAEPSKPFFPFMFGAAAAASPFTGYYALMMRYWTVLLNYQAAEGLYHAATQDLKSVTDGSDNKLANQARTYAVAALQQWAYLNFYQLLFRWQSFMSGFMAPHMAAANHAANANAFVQTEAPAAPAAPEFTPEQKELVESVVSQFLRPQPLAPQPSAQ